MSETRAWDLLLAKADIARTTVREVAVPEPGAGEALLRVDRVGVTVNNVTYARLGDALRYWDFFPAADGWGRVPLWGFADVEASNADGLSAGARVYGYFPSSSHLVVKPKVGDGGFRDVSEHRAELPGVYNVYSDTSTDPSYRTEHEDLQILYRPLFMTSFFLDDFLADNGFFGAERVVVSSASSKTAYGTAFCTGLREDRPRLVGLTSPDNVDFTSSLGIYDEVVSYDDVTGVDAAAPTAYVDVSGSLKHRETIHTHFTDLVYDAAVGLTHDDAGIAGGGDLPGPAPAFFFAPDQIKKRREDWGPGGIDKRYGETWAEFAPAVEKWVDVKHGAGSDDLAATWQDVLAGRVNPREGHVIALS
jgi:hypothetical protein